MMSNPFTRRRQKTGITVSYSERVETESKDRLKKIKDKERENEEKLFDSIYGGGDVLERVNDLSARPIDITAPTGPVNDQIPIARVYYHPGCYELDTEMQPPQTTRVKQVRPILPKDGNEEGVSQMRKQPLKKLVIPVSVAVAERQRESKQPYSGRPNGGGLKPYFGEIEKKPRYPDAEINPLRSYVSIANVREIIGSVIPLHLFDDSCYDENIEFKIPCYGHSLYSFNSETLEWRRCRVISHKDGVFKIVWANSGRNSSHSRKSITEEMPDDDRVKEVYRISLRFDFDDVERFEKRRVDAFMWRETVESEMKLRAFLIAQDSNNYPKPNPSIIQRITKKLNVESPMVPGLLQEAAEEFVFGMKLDKYITDCKDREKRRAFQKKGYEILSRMEEKRIHMQRLNPERLVLVLPEFKPYSIIATKLEETSGRLLFPQVHGVLSSSSFFEKLSEQITSVVQEVREDLAVVEIQTRQLLTSWPSTEATRLVTLIDYRIASVLRSLVMNALREFERCFKEGVMRIETIISNNISVETPTCDDLIHSGKLYLDELMSCFNKLPSSHVIIGEKMELDISIEEMSLLRQDVEMKWGEAVKESYEKLMAVLMDTREIVSSIPLKEFNEVVDLFPNTEDLVVMKSKLKNCQNDLSVILDEYPAQQVIGYISVNFDKLYAYLTAQTEKIRVVVCEYLTNKIFKLTDEVNRGIEELKERCARPPMLVEDWYNRHLLLMNLKANFGSINDGLDSTMVLFEFLDEFSYETKVEVSMAYYLKAELRRLLNTLPEFIRQEEIDLVRIKEEHESRKEALMEQIGYLFIRVERFHMKGELESVEEYIRVLEDLENQFNELKEDAKLEMSRDEMIEIPVTEYVKLKGIEKDLSMFLPFWKTVAEYGFYSQEWMSVPFLTLVPDDIIATVKRWKETLAVCREEFHNVRSFQIDNVEVESKNNHPLLESIDVIEQKIDEIISHIPIIQHLCNPVLRNRHWDYISDLTGKVINQNEGLTWHWVLESGIETELSEIAKISRNANSEYVIEKALTQMMEEVRSLSVVLKTEEGHTKIEDTTRVFQILSDHQIRIQEIFVPPHIKPFLMKIKEYDYLAGNLRTILDRTLEAQAAIDDLAPVMESQDVRKQSQHVTADYDANVKVFNRLANKLGDPSQFHDLLSNPKYFSIIDDLQVNLKGLKGSLEEIMEAKRKVFPPFRYLSDSQLIHLISQAEDSEKFDTLFTYLYPEIERALFDEQKCIGFRSLNGEEVKFIKPFDTTPESVETIFENFDASIVSTLSTLTFNLYKAGQISNLSKFVANTPSQIACLVGQLLFNTRVEKIFRGADTIFSERKITTLSEQFGNLLNGIERDIQYLADAAAEKPTIAISNLITTLIKQKEIVKELISGKALSATSHLWLKHLRYWCSGDTQETFTVHVGCGMNTCQYEFGYIGSGPTQFLTDSHEAVYADFMMSMEKSLNCTVIGPLHSFKTSSIADFARSIGRNCFVYSCSSLNTVEVLSYMIETSVLTGYFLILRDFHLLAPNVVTDMAPIIMSLSKKGQNQTQKITLFSTYTVDNSNEVPAHVRLLFRPVIMQPTDTGIVMKTFLTGVGLSKYEDLYHKLVSVTDNLSIVADPRYSARFSVRNIILLISKRPVDRSNPEADIFKRLIEELNDMDTENRSLIVKLQAIFGIEGDHVPQVNDLEIPAEWKPSSDVVTRCLQQFMEMIRYHRDLILIGPSLSGKTTIINAASKIMKKSTTAISPNAQSLEYMYSNKMKGLFFSAINNADWIVFDADLDDKWLSILALSMWNRSNMYFADGSTMKIADNMRFIYETDSLAHATPATLSYCAQLVMPENAVSYHDQLSGFLDKLTLDERIVEPVSGRLMGTTIPLTKFTNTVREFVTNILEYLLDKLPSITKFTKRHVVADFFKVLESIFSVHYYSSTKIGTFSQYPLKMILDDYRELTVFAAIWSFGAMMTNDRRGIFEDILREFASTNSISMPEQCIFDVYYNIGKKKWKLWKEMKTSRFYNMDTSLADIAPEYLELNPNTLISSLYFTNLMISQGKNLIIDSGSPRINNTITHLAVATDYMGMYFSQSIYQYPNNVSESDKNPLRKMIDQSLAGIRDGSRSMSKLPLLILTNIDVSKSLTTELLRFIVNRGYLINLETFTPDVTRSLRFILSTDIDNIPESTLNKRLLTNFTVIRVSSGDDESLENSVARSLKTLCGIPHSEAIAKVVYESISNIDSEYRFKFSHILKIIQRVAMVMDGNQPGFFLNALSYESAAVVYDALRSDEALATLDDMVKNVAKVMEIGQYELPKEHVHTKVLSNINSMKFRPIESVNETSLAYLPQISKQKRLTAFQSMKVVPQFHGHFIEVLDGLSMRIKEMDIPADDQRMVLKFQRMFTTPRTHVLINTNMNDIAREYVAQTANIMEFSLSEFHTGDNILKLIHDRYIEAGMKRRHQIIYIDEMQLVESDLEVVKAMILTPDLFDLFAPNEVLMILSELHCKPSDEDPFHEETLEAKSNYHMLVREFMRDCCHYFHFCVRSTDESKSFEFFFEHCQTIAVDEKLRSVIKKSSHNAITKKCKFDATTASKLLAMIQEKENRAGRNTKVVHLLRSITTIYNGLREEYSKNHDARHEILQKIHEVCVKVEKTMAETHQRMLECEEQNQKMSKELNNNTEITRIASEKALSEKEKLEAEEQILAAQQQQAEHLRKESEQSINAAKQLLTQSAQELRALSTRDISVIKTMNHPTKGVFLVMRSIVVTMGYAIEDKDDEPSGTQPSFVLGKKILSDTSFVSNFMKRALEGPKDEIIAAIRPIIADPNFEPSIVANSSTAAKSICQFIRAIVPYYEAQKVYEGKQKALMACQEHIKEIEKKHELAALRLNKANKEFEEADSKLKNMMLNKVRLEQQLDSQKQSVERHRTSVAIMKNFFDDWNREMNEMDQERSTIETHAYFMACCLSLYALYPAQKRDSIFETVSEVFREVGLDFIPTRSDLVERLKKDVLAKEATSSLHAIENVSLLSLPTKSWFFAIDEHHTILNVLKQVSPKRPVITSFVSSEFRNDLFNAILGNDFLIVYDYSVEINDPVFYQILSNRDSTTTIEMGRRQVEIPEDFQIVFIVDEFPTGSYFNALCIDLMVTDEEIRHQLTEKLYTVLDPEHSQTTISATKSANDSKAELKRLWGELQTALIESEENILDNDKVYKQFVSAANIIGRLNTQIAKLGELQNSMRIHYDKIWSLMGPFIALYHAKRPNDGIEHYQQILFEILSATEITGTLESRVSHVLEEMRRKLMLVSLMPLNFEKRMRLICKETPIQLGEYAQTIEEVIKHYGTDVLTQPATIPDIIDNTDCRRPVIINCSHYLLKYLGHSDRVVFASATKLIDGFNEALRAGKGLVTICNSVSLFQNIISVISKIRSANTLSPDFRLFIFTDIAPDTVEYPSTLLDFCDRIDTRRILSVRTLLSLSMSSLPAATFDTNISGYTNVWRRSIFLLAFYDAIANSMTQTLFQNDGFNEDNLDIMINYVKSLECPNFDDIGPLFIQSLYCVEQRDMQTNLMRVWELLFTRSNLENTSISLFDAYPVPAQYPPSQISSIISAFPLIDEPMSYGLALGSDHHYRKFEELMWKDTRFGKLNFTSIELRPIDVASTVWYMVHEAEEVNKRFLHSQHKFDRGLRLLLQKLRSPAPSIDLSVMFSPDRFFGLLKFNFLMNRKEKCASEEIVFLLTSDATEIAIENLIMINGDCDETGKFAYTNGSRILTNMYIRVCHKEPSMVKIPIYRKGAIIGFFHVYPKNVLPVDSVYLLTAFTTPTK